MTSVMGPPEVAYPTLARLKTKIQARLSLKLQMEKTEVYCEGDLPSFTPQDLPRAGVILEGEFFPGMEVYGVAMGHQSYVGHWLEGRLEEIREVLEKTCSLLQDNLQSKWTLLTALVAQKMS